MTSDESSNSRKEPPLLDPEALKAFMAREPSPEEAVNFMLTLLATRARLELILSGDASAEDDEGSGG